jgi:hypothetical protein
MITKKLTAADRYDTWDEGWEARLAHHVASLGLKSVWRYLQQLPGEPYDELAERLCASGGFGVAPVQIERLQVRDTPSSELVASVRDSLARHLQHAFKIYPWRQGAYWESRAIGALASWSAMWSCRVDLGPLRHRLFDLAAPEGWLPTTEGDPVLRMLVPDGALSSADNALS